jgi:hypothetical protein
MDQAAIGALVGWKWEPSEHGIILTLQCAQDADAFSARAFDGTTVVLNDRQLRSLTRDLMRASEERGIKLHAKPGRFRLLSR